MRKSLLPRQPLRGTVSSRWDCSPLRWRCVLDSLWSWPWSGNSCAFLHKAFDLEILSYSCLTYWYLTIGSRRPIGEDGVAVRKYSGADKATSQHRLTISTSHNYNLRRRVVRVHDHKSALDASTDNDVAMSDDWRSIRARRKAWKGCYHVR